MNYLPPLDAKVTLSVRTMLYSAALEKMPCDKSHILVAAQPKSGSTWLSEIFANLPGFTRAHLVPNYDYREQELAFERLIVFHEANYVGQHHIKFSRATEAYLNTFSIKPIVSIRNFFDCVPSMKDWLDGGEERIVGPTAYIPKDYFRWTDTEKTEFIIDMMIPWYFSFYVGWLDCQSAAWVDYDDLVTDPMATLLKASDTLDLNLTRSDIQSALDGASQQFTKKGTAQRGRGEQLLTKAQKDRIRKFASYYPSVDFARVGL